MSRQPQRLEFLDSIRGLAALAVLLSHSFVFDWPPLVAYVVNIPFLNIPFNGKEAVSMFFVLSGFLLSRPYFGSSSQGRPARKLFIPTFYLRRFTRIWMPWLGAFCLSALAQAFIFGKWTTVPPTGTWMQEFWQTPLTWHNALRQSVFILHDTKIQLLVQDWSLGIELKASILLPFLIFLSGILTSWGLVAVAVYLVVFPPMGPSYCSFVLGILLARHAEQILHVLTSKPLWVKIGILVLGLFFYEGFHFGVDWLNNGQAWRFYSLSTSIGCVLILMASLASRRIQATLHLPPLIFLGRISYSVYLLQFIVILCVLPAWVHLLNSWGIYRTIWLLPLNFIASVTLTLMLSALNYRFVERPCIDLGHRLSKKIQERLGKK